MSRRPRSLPIISQTLLCFYSKTKTYHNPRNYGCHFLLQFQNLVNLTRNTCFIIGFQFCNFILCRPEDSSSHSFAFMNLDSRVFKSVVDTTHRKTKSFFVWRAFKIDCIPRMTCRVRHTCFLLVVFQSIYFFSLQCLERTRKRFVLLSIFFSFF